VRRPRGRAMGRAGRKRRRMAGGTNSLPYARRPFHRRTDTAGTCSPRGSRATRGGRALATSERRSTPAHRSWAGQHARKACVHLSGRSRRGKHRHERGHPRGAEATASPALREDDERQPVVRRRLPLGVSLEPSRVCGRRAGGARMTTQSKADEVNRALASGICERVAPRNDAPRTVRGEHPPSGVCLI
jgi:hypothetical protein